MNHGMRRAWARFASHYGMLGVFVLLSALFSLLTLRDQEPSGKEAARRVVEALREHPLSGGTLVIVIRAGQPGQDDARFARTLEARARELGARKVRIVAGEPSDLRSALEEEAAALSGDAASEGASPEGAAPGDAAPEDAASGKTQHPLVVATLPSYAPMVQGVLASLPLLASTPIVTPRPYRWPTFLLASNLRNVAHQIAVIAIVAIGMTVVILTGGIDLSVGSLIALAAVVASWLIGRLGGESASVFGLTLGGAAAIVVCGAIGAFSGLMITRFRIPPFIATLAMMQVGSGLAYIISQGKPIYRLPDSAVVLGRGADAILGLPYAVWLMLFLYAAAHLLMARTTLGRYVYAVGGNAEAARLAGVRVQAVLLLAYVLCGALAGLGGVIMASQLKSGAPTYGLMYELYVIAAVVVGGTSLSGGEGKVLGTLIGAFIIAVIQNGMNLTNVESYTQKVVLGLVILGAVLLDQLKHHGWKRGRAGPRAQEEKA